MNKEIGKYAEPRFKLEAFQKLAPKFYKGVDMPGSTSQNFSHEITNSEIEMLSIDEKLPQKKLEQLEANRITNIINESFPFHFLVEIEKCYQEISKDFGEENRKYRETLFNEYSSRSHSIFQIFIESFEIKDEGENVINKFSCLNLIDLAGSERINEYESKNITTGETGYINKSLFVLAHVINKLAENNTGKKIHIPYRDSKLTILKIYNY